jgi:hypothetical protein
MPGRPPWLGVLRNERTHGVARSGAREAHGIEQLHLQVQGTSGILGRVVGARELRGVDRRQARHSKREMSRLDELLLERRSDAVLHRSRWVRRRTHRADLVRLVPASCAVSRTVGLAQWAKGVSPTRTATRARPAPEPAPVCGPHFELHGDGVDDASRRRTRRRWAPTRSRSRRTRRRPDFVSAVLGWRGDSLVEAASRPVRSRAPLGESPLSVSVGGGAHRNIAPARSTHRSPRGWIAEATQLARLRLRP